MKIDVSCKYLLECLLPSEKFVHQECEFFSLA